MLPKMFLLNSYSDLLYLFMRFLSSFISEYTLAEFWDWKARSSSCFRTLEALSKSTRSMWAPHWRRRAFSFEGSIYKTNSSICKARSGFLSLIKHNAILFRIGTFNFFSVSDLCSGVISLPKSIPQRAPVYLSIA